MSIKQSIKNITPEPLWNELRGGLKNKYQEEKQGVYSQDVYALGLSQFVY